jgi:biopolymer transport protein ExbD
MASPSFVKRKPPSDAASDIELDLTPMMSMFLILLPFLVSMAVLTHLTILEFSLPPNVAAAGNGNPSTEKPNRRPLSGNSATPSLPMSIQSLRPNKTLKARSSQLPPSPARPRQKIRSSRNIPKR